MGFRTNAWASVWSVEEGRGNTTKVRLSISRKNKDGEYEQDFSGFCTFIGNARAKAEKLKVKDRIKLGDVDVTTWYNKEKGIEYVTYKVFDFEFADGSGNSNNSTPARNMPAFDVNPPEGDSDEELLPF